MPRYQNKHQQKNQLLTVTCTIMPISDKSRFACAHVWPVCVITSSLLVAFANECFAFISICCKVRKKQGKKYTNKISTKDISVCFLSKSHRNSAIHKSLNLFVISCFKWFSGGNFQLSYYFWALLAVTVLSIRHTYELLLFCHGEASNIQGKQKNKTNQIRAKKTTRTNSKQADKPKQSEIYKRANEEYLTQAQ